MAKFTERERNWPHVHSRRELVVQTTMGAIAGLVAGATAGYIGGVLGSHDAISNLEKRVIRLTSELQNTFNVNNRAIRQTSERVDKLEQK